MIQRKTEECVRNGVTYRVETTWDDESGNAEIREFALDGRLVRSCDWRIWPEAERHEDQIGEAIWFDASGAEIERRPLRERGASNRTSESLWTCGTLGASPGEISFGHLTGLSSASKS